MTIGCDPSFEEGEITKTDVHLSLLKMHEKTPSELGWFTTTENEAMQRAIGYIFTPSRCMFVIEHKGG